MESNTPIRSIATNEAKQLLDQVGLRDNQPCGKEEYDKIQACMYPGYIIKVFSQHGGLLFQPPAMTKTSKVIHVYNHDNHYDCIVSITGFLGRGYYCEYCDVGYNTIHTHLCRHICACFSTELCPPSVPVQCQRCCRWFKSKECYDNHLQVRKKIHL